MDTSHLPELSQRAFDLVGKYVDIYYDPNEEEHFEAEAMVEQIISTNPSKNTVKARVKFKDSEIYTRIIKIKNIGDTNANEN